MRVTYQSQFYSADRVTGRYVRCQGKAGNYSFKVFEAASGHAGSFKGQPGMGYTLREYETDGAEIPDDVKQKAIKSKTTEKWD